MISFASCFSIYSLAKGGFVFRNALINSNFKIIWIVLSVTSTRQTLPARPCVAHLVILSETEILV